MFLKDIIIIGLIRLYLDKTNFHKTFKQLFKMLMFHGNNINLIKIIIGKVIENKLEFIKHKNFFIYLIICQKK